MATAVEKWVEKQAEMLQPKTIYWCDGSEGEARRLIEMGLSEERILQHDVFMKLNQKLWPKAYLHRSHPTDVARTEKLTFICHSDKETTGPNNNWMHPAEAKKRLKKLSTGAMRGKTMYVLPYMMGNPDSPYARACVQITDVSYVAVSMRIMTRLGKHILDKIGNSENFIKGLHTVGDFNPDKRFIMHFPEDNLVWSVGSGYGGNALLGKKCISLRIASWIGRKYGWLAEHMMIIGVEDIHGNITYIAGAFPSACGKTNFAMLESALPEYRIWTIGDDIAWLNIGPDGRLYAINPESGFFGVAPGTSMKTNPNMMRTLRNANFYPTLFTNVGLDLDNLSPWWEGLDGPVPENMVDWQGRPWKPGLGTTAAHPNSRFTVSVYNCPTLSREYDSPMGVPISALIFGGRRTRLIPLITEAFNWEHGVFMGARMGSETTAAAAGKVGVLRRDPMAMLPFCGYNMGDYFRHWINMGRLMSKPPRIYSINAFRRNEKGEFLWPGFGENIRILKWIIERVNGRAGGRETPLGIVPEHKDLDLNGLDLPGENLEELFRITPGEWQEELADVAGFLTKFGRHMPYEIWQEYDRLKRGLGY